MKEAVLPVQSVVYGMQVVLDFFFLSAARTTAAPNRWLLLW